MKETLSVEITDAEVLPPDADAWRYNEFFKLTTAAKNHGTVGIRAYTGVLQIDDVFGRSITRINWTYDDAPIGPGEELVDADGGLELNPFIDRHQKLANTPKENLKFSFVTRSIIFADGTQLGKAD